MRRIAIACVTVLALACDPTGGLAPDFDSARFRFGNFVSDATGITVVRGNINVATNVGFGAVSSPINALTGQAILQTRRASDGFQLGLDTVSIFKDRRYTYYGLGEVSNFVPLVAQQDTVLPTGGQFKVRFVHGAVSEEAFTLDFYTDASSNLAGITPTYPALSYGTASLYAAVDTGLRRFRWTRNGSTTPVFDTTFSSSIPAGAIVTLVLTDKQGGGTPLRVTRVNDTIP